MSSVVMRLIAIGTLSATLAAQTSPSSYSFERPVTSAGAGPARLAIDVPLLIGASPVPTLLADLRLVDQDGREVQYLLVNPPAAEPEWLPGTVLPVVPTKKTSGFEADLGAPALVDRLHIEGIAAPFLKRAILEGSGDREHWTLLAPEATVFNLPAERLKRTEIEFPRGEFRYLRVTWDDTNSGRVAPPPYVRARRVATVPAPPSLVADVPFERRASEPGKSRFRLRLPARQLPIVRIDLDVDAPHVMRRAVITEPYFDGKEVQPRPIGDALLKRVTRDGVRADELSIRISRPTDAELQLVVDDENNPPLALTRVTALFAPMPTIYFESDGRPLVARYGTRRAEAPRYDLEAVRESLRLDMAAVATWGEPAPRALTEAPAPAPPMPATGATLDASAFRHARQIASGPAGLVAVPLDAAVLAHSSSTTRAFSDVRVLDGSGRQIPYVVERRDEPLTLSLEMSSRAAPPAAVKQGSGQSWYVITLPYENLPAGRLTIETPARVFKRAVSLVRENPPDSRRRTAQYVTLEVAHWVNTSADVPAMPLQLAVPPLPTREMFLLIDEGDNDPLPLQKLTLLLPSYRLRFFRPDTAPLTLAYGRDDLTEPEYDLMLLASEVLGATAEEIASAGEAEATKAPSNVLVNPAVFWSVLGGALVVLLGMIVRLMRSEPVNVG